MKHLIVFFSFSILLTLSCQAQTIEGDALFTLLGSKVVAPNTQQFFNTYGIKNKMHGVYFSSKTGVYVQAKHDTIITSITVYKDNQFSGSYKNKMPKGLKFDMRYDEVVKVLGKPNYTSPEGMAGKNCVYRTSEYEVVYWFKNDALEQASYSLKKQ